MHVLQRPSSDRWNRPIDAIWHPRPHVDFQRQGASLVEILMSLMVMAIGLVSVASLFPIAMVRSMQSTQLTNASLLGYQVEGYVQADPLLARRHFSGGVTIPNREFRLGSVAARRYGLTPENYLSRLPINVVTVIDPIGYYQIATQTGAPNFTAGYYGYDPDPDPVVNPEYFPMIGGEPWMYKVERLNAGFNLSNRMQREAAFRIFSSSDTWKAVVTASEVQVAATPPAGVDPANSSTLLLNDVSGADMEAFRDTINSARANNSYVFGRLVAISANRRQVHTSPIYYIGGASSYAVFSSPSQVSISRRVVGQAFAQGISEVRLELFELQYSSMITIARRLTSLGAGGLPGAPGVDDDGDGNVDIIAPGQIDVNEVAYPGTDDVLSTVHANLVVFFRRDFSPQSEQVYEAIADDTERQRVLIRWRSTNPDQKPVLRAGAWIFDMRLGNWYRITGVDREGPAGTPPGYNTVNDRQAYVNINRPAESGLKHITIPQNVVEVFNFSLE
jgi:hypothetical protein